MKNISEKNQNCSSKAVANNNLKNNSFSNQLAKKEDFNFEEENSSEQIFSDISLLNSNVNFSQDNFQKNENFSQSNLTTQLKNNSNVNNNFSQNQTLQFEKTDDEFDTDEKLFGEHNYLHDNDRISSFEKSENNIKSNFQSQSENSEIVSLKSDIQSFQLKENNTGLPNNLKAGIENLSGFSMDDVKVHYNSNKPAGLQAFAYTQGTNIHVAPGQEKHLAHEAWHVVQQKQGRVKPTFQMKENISVNDDKGLEYEADIMGAKANQQQEKSNYNNIIAFQTQLKSNTIQKAEIEHHALNDNPQPDSRSPFCYTAVLTWLYAQYGYTDNSEILEKILDKDGPSILINKILKRSQKLESKFKKGGDQLRLQSGKIVIFATSGTRNATHAAVATGALQITGYNQTHWFGQAANVHSHSGIEGVIWQTKDTINNFLGYPENVYQIDAESAASAIGLVNKT